MLQANELTHFGIPTCTAAPQLPSAALAGASWTKTDEDPFFADIDLAAMGYRPARKVPAEGSTRAHRLKAFPSSSMHAIERVLFRFHGNSGHFANI